MPDHTHRTIQTAQNTVRAQRFLAAQSRLYTDAKHLHDARVLTVVALAIATVIVALANPDARTIVGTVGGAVTFFWSVLGSSREKRCRKQAVSIQEEFDTHVFGIPWNSMAAEHPSPTVIAETATRYRGKRTKDWYPDTGPVARPLDILICQRSNLGWGAPVHQLYAAIIASLLVALTLAAIALAVICKLTATDALTMLLVPLLGPARELIEMIRNNRESAEAKSKAESKVNGLWERALQHGGQLTIDDCRAVQDQILTIRLTNAHVPDWLDNLRRDRNENLMQQSAVHLIEEAVNHGKTR
ncbi:S-4TM family putative pore-forming effector [Promicromonospora sp. NPDC023805]|uniref:S-4TM family putative pore-forming effector n=1 Tax=Promicromonospora sp. NPDC023805 TaxID=3154696 RepID=UPI0033E2EA66